MTCGRAQAGIAALAVFALAAAGCYSMRQWTSGRSGTIAGCIIVRDAETGEPIEGALVVVSEGFRNLIESAPANKSGQMMFSRRYDASSHYDLVWPPYLVIETYKDGYQGIKQSVDTDTF
ncbi:MAG TPA: hypothetical protein ENN09_03935, partial [Planctomycetes bacterium]|nr:hypothetical protein [Planctomycetota bacterium]